jgi:hypothetical protein
MAADRICQISHISVVQITKLPDLSTSLYYELREGDIGSRNAKVLHTGKVQVNTLVLSGRIFNDIIADIVRGAPHTLLCGIGKPAENWSDLRVYTFDLDLNVRFAQHAYNFARLENIPVNITLPIVNELPAVLLESEQQTA